MLSAVDNRVLRRVVAELPGTILLAVTTAVVTLMLILVVSVFLGGENSEHRVSSRCVAWLQRELVVDLADHIDPHFDASKYPALNIDGIDCGVIFTPLDPLAQ
jgi:hypothetical protein